VITDKWTRITFKPDLSKFNMTRLDDDFIALTRKKRVLDVAAKLGMTQFRLCSTSIRRHGLSVHQSPFPGTSESMSIPG
jgi:hypothetical protein